MSGGGNDNHKRFGFIYKLIKPSSDEEYQFEEIRARQYSVMYEQKEKLEAKFQSEIAQLKEKLAVAEKCNATKSSTASSSTSTLCEMATNTTICEPVEVASNGGGQLRDRRKVSIATASFAVDHHQDTTRWNDNNFTNVTRCDNLTNVTHFSTSRFVNTAATTTSNSAWSGDQSDATIDEITHRNTRSNVRMFDTEIFVATKTNRVPPPPPAPPLFDHEVADFTASLAETQFLREKTLYWAGGGGDLTCAPSPNNKTVTLSSHEMRKLVENIYQKKNTTCGELASEYERTNGGGGTINELTGTNETTLPPPPTPKDFSIFVDNEHSKPLDAVMHQAPAVVVIANVGAAVNNESSVVTGSGGQKRRFLEDGSLFAYPDQTTSGGGATDQEVRAKLLMLTQCTTSTVRKPLGVLAADDAISSETTKQLEFEPPLASTRNIKHLMNGGSGGEKTANLVTIFEHSFEQHNNTKDLEEKEMLLSKHLATMEKGPSQPVIANADTVTEPTLSKILADELAAGATTKWSQTRFVTKFPTTAQKENEENVDLAELHVPPSIISSKKQAQKQPQQQADKTELGSMTQRGVLTNTTNEPRSNITIPHFDWDSDYMELVGQGGLKQRPENSMVMVSINNVSPPPCAVPDEPDEPEEQNSVVTTAAVATATMAAPTETQELTSTAVASAAVAGHNGDYYKLYYSINTSSFQNMPDTEASINVAGAKVYEKEASVECSQLQQIACVVESSVKAPSLTLLGSVCMSNETMNKTSTIKPIQLEESNVEEKEGESSGNSDDSPTKGELLTAEKLEQTFNEDYTKLCRGAAGGCPANETLSTAQAALATIVGVDDPTGNLSMLSTSSSMLSETIVSAVRAPFDIEVKNRLLARGPLDDLKKRKTNFVVLRTDAPRLKTNMRVTLSSDEHYNVLDSIGQGAYAHIYLIERTPKSSAKEQYALKVDTQPTAWEYYITESIHERLERLNMRVNVADSFVRMHRFIRYNNGCLSTMPYYRLGSLLDLINVHVQKNEPFPYWFTIYLTVEMLLILDYLHKCQIIHADIKPDNLLVAALPDNLAFFDPSRTKCLVLIDFNRSLDLSMLPAESAFDAKTDNKSLLCCEMKSNRPWTYQIDYFGMLSSLHCVVHRKYMTTFSERGRHRVTLGIPRQYDGLFSRLFDTFLNIPSCQSMPDLQGDWISKFMVLLKQELGAGFHKSAKYLKELADSFEK